MTMPCESGASLEYRHPGPHVYRTHPLDNCCGAPYDPLDYDASNADWALFITEVKARLV